MHSHHHRHHHHHSLPEKTNETPPPPLPVEAPKQETAPLLPTAPLMSTEPKKTSGGWTNTVGFVIFGIGICVIIAAFVYLMVGSDGLSKMGSNLPFIAMVVVGGLAVIGAIALWISKCWNTSSPTALETSDEQDDV